jgi:uncharacterized protein YecE (DUF72 family)
MPRARPVPSATALVAAEPPLASLRGGPMPARVGNVALGTASWTDRTLIESETFYPRRLMRAEDRLRFYARHFPVVEVDSSFYALPAARNAVAWAERTPADFTFGVKAFAAMTQHPFVPARLPPDLRAALGAQARAARLYARDLPPAVDAEIWRQFAAGVAPLAEAGKLGYVLLQFPKWFPYARASLAYLERAIERLPGHRLAIEFREPSWLAADRAETTLAFLRARGLVYVAVDEPQGTPASVPPLAAATSDALAVIRFHGRNAAAWNRPGVGVEEKFSYLYGGDELHAWVPKIRELAARARAVHVLMNNCGRHYAVQGAKDLARLLAAALTADT